MTRYPDDALDDDDDDDAIAQALPIPKVKALSPDEVDASSVARKVEERTADINAMLQDGRRTYACSLFGNRHVMQAVMERFQDVGWHIEVMYDLRDGDYLEFSRRR